MPSLATYRTRAGQGCCPNCGGPRDQAHATRGKPYTKCSRCYTPHPHQPRVPWQAQYPSYAAYRQALGVAWRWRARQHTTAPLEIGCCGVWHPVTQVPVRMPCCGRVFGEVTHG